MAIRRSSSADVEGLIAELLSPATRPARRETALARLAVIGSRAVGHLLAALEHARTSGERQLLLAALERVPDARSLDAILVALGPSNAPDGAADLAVRAAAVRAARPLLRAAPERTALLERLAVLVLDAAEPLPLRRAALDALDDLPPRTLEPVRQRLLEDPDPAVRQMAGASPGLDGEGGSPEPSELADDPIVALEFVRQAGGRAPLSLLHGLLTQIRERESSGGRRRPDWTAVRGAVHVALARRQSRVGLYDLREAFETRALHPLPSDFALAMRLVGDATCLEPLARAWMAAPSASRDARTRAWTREVREAFDALLAREHAASRRRIVARLRKHWSAAPEAKQLAALVGT